MELVDKCVTQFPFHGKWMRFIRKVPLPVSHQRGVCHLILLTEELIICTNYGTFLGWLVLRLSGYIQKLSPN